MEALKSRDLRAALGFLEDAYAIRDYNTFGHYVVSALPNIVQSKSVGFHPFPPGKRRIQVTRCAGTPFLNPPDLFLDRGLQFYVDHFATYPLASIVLQTPSGEVVKISDFFSERVWQRNEWYNEVCRPVRLWDQIIFNLAPSDSPLVCDLVALNAPRAFTERDRSMLHLLRPHLRQALLNAQAITRMQEEPDQVRKAVEAMDRGIVVLAETGRIGLITSKARQLITEYFASPRADRLPEALDSWARYQKSLLGQKDDIPASTKPLVVARDEKKLVVRLVPNGSGHVLLLEERQPEISPGNNAAKLGAHEARGGGAILGRARENER